MPAWTVRGLRWAVGRALHAPRGADVVSRVQAAAAARAEQDAAAAARERDRIRLEEEALDRTPPGRVPGLSEVPGLTAAFRSAGVPVDLCLPPGVADLDPRLGLAVYRIVEEGLENARRHAPGADVRVEIRVAGEADPQELTVLVSDDGPPAGSGPPGDGRGLIALRERVTGCGGRFSAGPARVEGGIGSGWTIQARFPVGAQTSR